MLPEADWDYVNNVALRHLADDQRCSTHYESQQSGSRYQYRLHFRLRCLVDQSIYCAAKAA